jgi:hypothetical protein
MTRKSGRKSQAELARVRLEPCGGKAPYAPVPTRLPFELPNGSLPRRVTATACIQAYSSALRITGASSPGSADLSLWLRAVEEDTVRIPGVWMRKR